MVRNQIVVTILLCVQGMICIEPIWYRTPVDTEGTEPNYTPLYVHRLCSYPITLYLRLCPCQRNCYQGARGTRARAQARALSLRDFAGGHALRRAAADPGGARARPPAKTAEGPASPGSRPPSAGGSVPSPASGRGPRACGLSGGKACLIPNGQFRKRRSTRPTV